MLFAGCGLREQAQAQEKPIVVEHGVFQVNLLLHSIGSEEYTITDQRDGHFRLTSTTNANDRGMKRTTVATLDFGAHDEPLRLEQKTTSGTSTTTLLTEIAGTTATVHEADETRAFARPAVAFTGFTSMPAAVEIADDALLDGAPSARKAAAHARERAGSAA